MYSQERLFHAETKRLFPKAGRKKADRKIRTASLPGPDGRFKAEWTAIFAEMPIPNTCITFVKLHDAKQTFDFQFIIS